VPDIQIKFPDGSIRAYPQGVRSLDILGELNGRLARESIAAVFNGKLVDLTQSLDESGELLFITPDSPEGRDIYWHSSAHVMAHAVKELYPKARFAFGPPVEDGFYYDIDVPDAFTPDDLARIEEKMKEIVAADAPFVREELSKDEAISLFRGLGEDYKIEQIERLGEPPSIYKEGSFTDLCRGPHVPSTGHIKHFKLLSVAAAYWLADEKNASLQRIYGISFPKKSQLDDYLNRLEEAKKRDHRRLGRELDLFSINEEIGAGLVLWHPKGAFVRHKIEEFWRQQHLSSGYNLVNTPHVAKRDLWNTSGHLDFFAENMYSSMKVDEVEYLVKPMNCPFHLLIYKSQTRSYRDLPIRWAELGTVYRYERSGVLHGLLRVRGFTQDDAHIICRPEQLDAEIARLLDFCLSMLRSFGFSDYEIYLSTRPKNSIGEIENWERATQALKSGMENAGISYQIDPGEGVFYGPKIDIKIRDVLRRTWQCSTIQVDFNEPERFDITYVGQDGNRHRPIMIHRALLGSLERFFGVLIEHFGGAFPLWLAPVQAAVIPITDRQQEYARQMHEKLLAAGIRSSLDDRSEKVGYKIREAETQKIPYMLVIGQKEVDGNEVSLRKRREGDQGTRKIESIIAEIQEKVIAKVAD
jgi:threonyl-tRNA synthetase